MSRQLVSSTRGRLGRYAAAGLGSLVLLGLGLIAPSGAQAAGGASSLYVSQGGADSGTCTSTSPCATITYALTQAASGATIEVSGTIDDHPSISSPVTITTWPNGPAGSPGVIDGTKSGTVVDVGVGTTGVVLNDLTIENGALGIYNDGTLTLSDSTVTGNATVAEPYAGVWNYSNGSMTILDSTIADNTGASGAGIGAGIYNTGAMTVVASTVSGNSGGGIYSGQDVTASLGATIVANNTGVNCDAYDAASLDSAGYNLTNDATGTACSFTAATDVVDTKPHLGALANNGGPTDTMLPSAKSKAVDRIPTSVTTLHGEPVCPGTDQRGVARPGLGETGCTIGAVEGALKNATTTTLTVSPSSTTAGTRVAYLAVVTAKSGAAAPVGTIAFTTGSTALCTAVLSGGVAACGATNAPTGTDTVTGTYSGGDGDATSSGTATLTVKG